MATPPPHQTSTAELEALVRQLRQELADKERRIAQLQSQLAQLRATAQPTESNARPPAAEEEASTGSQADLLAQLDKLYQEK